MSFLPGFAITQPIGFPNKLTITDIGSGTDAAIVDRRIYLAIDSGNFLMPIGNTTQYIDWPIGTSSLTITCLDKDYAILVTLQYLNVTNDVLYSAEGLEGLTLYNETFDYYLTQMMTANKALITDNDFWSNKSLLRTDIDGGNQAITLANDISNAQLCYDQATELRLASQYFYNANA